MNAAASTGFKPTVLLAVDDSENARRAVTYVGSLLGGLDGFRVMVLHVVPEPDEDFFETPEEKMEWSKKRKIKVDAMLDDYRRMLIEAGFDKDQVTARSARSLTESASTASPTRLRQNCVRGRPAAWMALRRSYATPCEPCSIHRIWR